MLSSMILSLRQNLKLPEIKPSWLLIFGVQALLMLTFVFNQKVPPVATLGAMLLMVLMDQPIWSVGIMLGSRLLSTGTMSFFTIGRVSIGLFEPVLLVALGGLGLRAFLSQKQIWRTFPWMAPFLALLGWNVLGLLWAVSRSDGLKDILALCVICATTLVVLSFIETWEQVKLMLSFWIGTCVLIGLLGMFGDKLGLTDFSSQWQAASKGGRETGLGQQPNWYSMNLMFVVHATAAFALIQRHLLVRWGLMMATLFIFFSQMSSGSRGGAYAIVIGGFLVALGQADFRRWMGRFTAIGGFLFLIAWVGDFGSISRGFNRISTNVDTLFARDIRGMNWIACGQMFTDTYGLGIGPGGYVDKLETYNWWLFQSVYRYPHGIFWGQMAHGGVVGILLFGALVWQIARMSVQTIRDCRGTEAEGIAWTMPAAMAGYFAWSFVEFEIDEKPFWEWLALYTALHLVARRAKEGKGPPIPVWRPEYVV